MYSVGNLNIANGVFLAPMEDVSDQVFRKICKKFGADMVFTEFVSSEALRRDVVKSKIKIEFDEEERPLGIQIFGNNAESLAAAAQIAQQNKPDVIDINWGCPVKKVAYKGGGSGALKDPEELIRMTEAVVKAVDLPVTVKTRTGWDHETRIIVQLARELESIGIKALTVHGRTRAQMYKGEADWDIIGQVKQAVDIPVIGNGDIKCGDDVRRAFDDYQVDAVMIGRAAIGKPWLFREVKNSLTGEAADAGLSYHERLDAIKAHYLDSVAYKQDERIATLEMRKHFSAYFKGFPGAGKMRAALMQASSVKEVMSVFAALQQTA
jgi:tRNA-dihydrouridine synthase B